MANAEDPYEQLIGELQDLYNQIVLNAGGVGRDGYENRLHGLRQARQALPQEQRNDPDLDDYFEFIEDALNERFGEAGAEEEAQAEVEVLAGQKRTANVGANALAPPAKRTRGGKRSSRRGKRSSRRGKRSSRRGKRSSRRGKRSSRRRTHRTRRTHRKHRGGKRTPLTQNAAAAAAAANAAANANFKRMLSQFVTPAQQRQGNLVLEQLQREYEASKVENWSTKKTKKASLTKRLKQIFSKKPH